MQRTAVSNARRDETLFAGCAQSVVRNSTLYEIRGCGGDGGIHIQVNENSDLRATLCCVWSLDV